MKNNVTLFIFNCKNYIFLNMKTNCNTFFNHCINVYYSKLITTKIYFENEVKMMKYVYWR